MYATIALPLHSASASARRAPIDSADALRRALRGPGIVDAPDASRLDRVLCMDAARGLVEAHGGTSWRALAERVGRDTGATIAAFAEDPWMPAALGESLARNAPGPDGRPLVEHVEALALATPGGDLRRVSRTRRPDLFALAIGGHGAFGVIYSASLRVGSLACSAARALRPEVLELEPPRGAGVHAERLLVPPAALAGFLERIRAEARAWRVPVQRVVVRPTLPETQTRLRWARRDYAAVELRLRAPQELAAATRTIEARRAFIAAAIECGGSFELLPASPAGRAQVLACYPDLGSFLAEKRRHDPAERLQNDWYRRYRSLLSPEAGDVRWARRRA